MAPRLTEFLAEIRRRKVTRSAIAYVVVGISVVEGAEILGSPLGLSDSVLKVLAYLVVAGFPVAMVLSWIFDFTSEGIQRSEPASPTDSKGGPKPRWTPGRVVLVETTLIVALLAGYFLILRSPPGRMNTDRVAIAVLPFDNLSGAEEAEGFINGFHDDVITQLSKIHAFQVTSRTSVMGYRGGDRNLRQVGEELGVGTILEGGVQKDQQRIRINVQLIDAETDAHIWSDTYDREYSVGNLFAIQSDLSEKIAGRLHAQIRPEEARRIAALPTQDTVAYGLFLRGTDLFVKSPAEHETAMELFRQAIRIDPGFVRAYSSLAAAHIERIRRYGYPVEWADTAYQLAERALELDPESSAAHYSLGISHYHLDRLPEAREECRSALAFDPSSAGAMLCLGIVAATEGRLDEAFTWYVHSVAVNPRHANSIYNVGNAANALGLAEEAIEWLVRAENAGSDPAFINNGMVMAELRLGRIEEAKSRAEEFAEGNPDNIMALYTLGGVALLTQDSETARYVVDRALQRFPEWGLWNMAATIRTFGAWAFRDENPEMAAQLLMEARVWAEEGIAEAGPTPGRRRELAAVAALEGNAEEALRWLEGSIGIGPEFLRRDARFGSLLSDPRFLAYVEREEMRFSAMRERVERGEVDLGIG